MKKARPFPKQNIRHNDVSWSYVQTVEHAHIPDLEELLDAFATVVASVYTLGCELPSLQDELEMHQKKLKSAQRKNISPERMAELERDLEIYTARVQVITAMLRAGQKVRTTLKEFYATLQPIEEWRSEYTWEEWDAKRERERKAAERKLVKAKVSSEDQGIGPASTS